MLDGSFVPIHLVELVCSAAVGVVALEGFLPLVERFAVDEWNDGEVVTAAADLEGSPGRWRSGDEMNCIGRGISVDRLGFKIDTPRAS